MVDKIKWFWRYYRRYPYILLVLLLLTPVQTVFQVSIPRMIDFTVDYMDTKKVSYDFLAIWMVKLGAFFNFSPVVTFALSFIVLGLIASILYMIVQGHRAWMNLKLEWLFRQNAFDDITLKGPDFFNRFRTGDLVTRMTDDVAQKLSWFACSGIFRLYEALLMVGFTIAMMVTINPVLTLWVMIPLPILIVVFFRSATLLDKRYDYLQTRISRFNDIMETCFYGIRVVKAYVREKAQRKKFDHAAVERRDAEISSIKMSTVIDSLYMYIWQVSVIIILLVGGYLVMHDEMSRGKLGSFIFYTVWLVFPMFDIGQFLVKSRQSAVSINRLVELEKVPPMVEEKATPSENGNIKGNLDLKDVSFSFSGLKYDIINEVSLSVPVGKTVALVGRVGAGKSWLVNMIPRLVDPSRGLIYLDGHRLQEYKLEELRHSIGYVPQEPVLFSDTVKNNILMGRKNISDADLDWAIEVSQLKDEIKSFPQGINTFIGTRGMTISGGQKQRLALSRALAGKPKILILDDCTSALDSQTEAALWEQLHRVLPGISAILITHRPDTLQKADIIYVLDKGKIVETGTHAQLLAQNGVYAKIYKRYLLEEEVK